VSRSLFKKTPRSTFLAISAALLVALSLQRIRREFAVQATTPQSASSNAYLGFDRNQYPGDENLAALRRTFAFTGYWLNAPPGATSNPWTGKRGVVKNAGFGFLVLFNGRLDAELRKADPQSLGRSDAGAALESAQREGFPKNTVIFLDLEEGGRMLPEQNAYIFAWVDTVNHGGFRAGIYCSGIAAVEGSETVITAEDIRQHANGRAIAYWIANDACPPAPGCAFPQRPPLPQQGGVRFAEVWQFAQSPRRRDFARGCGATYDRDGNCYPPGLAEQKLFVDVDTAGSEDPSGGR
jgi:hypothetical protein